MENALNTEHLFRNSVDGIIGFDRDIRYTFWNPAMEEITGVPSETVIGGKAFDLFPFLEEIGEDRYFKEALEGKSGSSRSSPFFIPSTSRSGFFEGHYSPVRDEKGEIIGGMAIIRNVTDRAQREANERFRFLVEQAPFSLQFYGNDGQCTYANLAWEKFWEADRSELRDYNVLKDPQAAKSGILPFIQRAFNGEAVTVPDTYYDPKLIGKTGRGLWVRLHFYPIKDDNGKILEVALMGEDVTDTKTLENLAEDLQNAIQARDSFLSIASHELRTPVTSLKLQAQMVKRSIERGEESSYSPDKLAKIMDQTDKSLGRLSKLIEDMLDVSRVQTGKLSLNFETFDLAELVNEVLERFGAQFHNAQMEVSVDVKAHPTGPWDRHRLDQVLTNLLSNALRYAPGGPLTIRIGQENNFAVIEVKDSGPGIAPENQCKIFQRFERLISRTVISGMGLGLYIVKEIVEAHGGSIRVESEVGHGANFIIRLPT